MEQEAGRVGRPRSEEARDAVLHAVDDLLLEVGYAGMTMKGIAERAGVGRQTVYRWWSTKAEILLEASADDAEQELAVEDGTDPADSLARYLVALRTFLLDSAAGAAYRALLAAAQHDEAVARLVERRDPVLHSATAVLTAIARTRPLAVPPEEAAVRLVGPTVFSVLAAHGRHVDPHRLALSALQELTREP